MTGKKYEAPCNSNSNYHPPGHEGLLLTCMSALLACASCTSLTIPDSTVLLPTRVTRIWIMP